MELHSLFSVAGGNCDVEVDGGRYIYIVDQALAGVHIIELTGPALQAAALTKAKG